ncbi:hypothetical protein U0070_025900 [Myodes glareolus]|uniref:Uncharacterized protein n=1 Tax=Myodes glareolus TaxID=447135 RepID=A0AAW0HTY3_MYOGA
MRNIMILQKLGCEATKHLQKGHESPFCFPMELLPQCSDYKTGNSWIIIVHKDSIPKILAVEVTMQLNIDKCHDRKQAKSWPVVSLKNYDYSFYQQQQQQQN